jgi:hypothetical protein
MTRERRMALTTWTSLGLAALLGTYVYVVEVKGGAQSEQRQEAAAHVVSISASTATELVIEHGRNRVVCRKEGSHWRVVAPVRAEGDDVTIERVLKDVAEAKIDRTVAAHTANPATFGLAEPVTIVIADGARREAVQVGKENPTGGFVFARRGADPAESRPVLLVDRRLRDAADKQLYDLRDKTALDFSSDEVASITFRRGSRVVRLVRSPATPGEAEARWDIVEPVRARADRGEIQRSLNVLSFVRAERFASETPVGLERFGLAPPWGSARFDLGGARAQSLLIGARTTDGALTRNYARRPSGGPVFTINDNLARDVDRAPETWREHHVVDFNRNDAAELRLITSSATVTCAKQEGGDWGVAEFRGPVVENMDLGAAARMATAVKGDRDRIEQLLGSLGTLEAKSFISAGKSTDGRFGLNKPSLKVVVLDKGKKPLATVSFGARNGPLLFATGPHIGGVFAVGASDVEKFHRTASDLAAR